MIGDGDNLRIKGNVKVDGVSQNPIDVTWVRRKKR